MSDENGIDPHVVINKQTIELSPLNCGQLKRVTALLTSGKPIGGFAAVERWLPFILESIQILNPNYTEADLDKMTMLEFTPVLNKLVEISGIQLSSGGAKPAAELDGQKSTDVSALRPAGTSVN